MTNLIPIGRFAQITRLSIKALRLYADEGLLLPSYIDPETGYRYYQLVQAIVAARVRLLRSLEMPLEEVREVLRADDPEAVRFLLLRHQERIAARMAKDQHALLQLQQLVEKQEDFMAHTVKIKEVQAQPVVSIRTHTPDAAFGQVIPLALRELIAYAERTGVRRRDLPPVVIHHQYTEEDADIEIGIAIERAVAGEERITSRTIPGGPVAYVIHVGPYDELGIVYPALAVWIQEHGYETDGPPREAFLNDWERVANPAEYQTEVVWPIR
jgi:effector-binding domain-containing protein